MGSHWNRASENGHAVGRQKRSKGRFCVTIVLIGFVALLTAVATYVACENESLAQVPSKKSSNAIKAVKPAGVSRSDHHTAVKSKQGAGEVKESDWRTWLLQKAATDPKLMFHLTNRSERIDARTFSSSIEQSMDWIFSCIPGDRPLPLLDAEDVDKELLTQVLISINEVNEEDSETDVARKENVMAAKAELRKYIKEGGDYESFMRYYHNLLDSYHETWLEAQDAVDRSISEMPKEDLATFIDKVNATLDEKGIKHVMLDSRIRRKLGMPLEEEQEEIE